MLQQKKTDFKLYAFHKLTRDGILYEKINKEVEKDLGISHSTYNDSQDKTVCPKIIELYGKKVSKRINDEGYMSLLSGHKISFCQKFETYLRIEVDLVENDVRLALKNYIANCVTCKTFLNCHDTNYPIDIENDDISMKKKRNIRISIGVVKFDEKSFFSTLLGLTSCWDYKHSNENLK